jgi:hypothetical protein
MVLMVDIIDAYINATYYYKLKWTTSTVYRQPIFL